MPGAASVFESYYLFVDSSSNLYLSDFETNQVVCFAAGYSFPQVVGGNVTIGSGINQLNGPLGIFLDDFEAVYVADCNNHRVQKWNYRVKFGTTVAGDGTAGSDLSQLNCVSSVIVDTRGNIYISQERNSRVVRWTFNSDVSIYIVGCSGSYESNANQLKKPQDLVFDSYGSFFFIIFAVD
ncbi:unnamed protein product [Adineta ricciae]|uniref:NHL repeat protein n=1 Tax=Adineta ricciae TaxID=249248 RepID=A0A814VFW2_ADIRI|nr:unnamed protein product [Adineta ricciae]